MTLHPSIRFRRRSGATRLQILALLLALVLLAGYWFYKDQYGLTGQVAPLAHVTADRIAFIRQDGGRTNLFTVASDGSDLRQHTDDKSSKRSPAWSPDGTQLAYSAEPDSAESEGRAFQIFVVGQGKPQQITRGSQSKDAPQWRPGGRQIAFLAGGSVKVVEPNGSDLLQLYPPPHKGKAISDSDESAETADPTKMPPIINYQWSPNGTALAGVQVTEGEIAPTLGTARWWERGAGTRPDQPAGGVMEPETIVMLPDLSADKPVVLASTNARKVSFSWFPDSVRLAVAVSTRRGEHAIGVYRADDPNGAPLGLFASAGYGVAPENPAVSPDGKQVAFEVWRMESPENRTLLGIAIVSTESGRMVRVLTREEAAKIPLAVKGDAHMPRWAPDGSRLLYWTYGKAGRDIWVARADGSNAVNVTKGIGDNADAAWSPVKR